MNFWNLKLFLFSSFFVILHSRIILASEPGCQHDDKNFRCVIFERNYDGDTITVSIPNLHPLLGRQISVRLLGIDTPEISSKNSCEKAAARNTKRLVESLLKGAKRIDLSNVQRDKYFRILAEVKVDDRSLNEILIKNGLAVIYDGGTKPRVDWCLKAHGPDPSKF